MAYNILHSGSFLDSNSNEIFITFYEKPSASIMKVEPSSLSFTENGGTKTLRVSRYTGTLNISVTGGTGWLGYTDSTSSGITTYTFTAATNTSSSIRNATITLTDDNGTETVQVTQAGAASYVTVNPNYIVFSKNGETMTATVTWEGGTTPTWSNEPEWATITSSVSGNTMTLTIVVGSNTSQYQRNATVYVSNGVSRAELALEQEAVHTVTVNPNSFTGANSFPAEGGTQILTITGIEGAFNMNYDGDGLSVVLLDYPSDTSRRYNVTYTQNSLTSSRTGVINVRDTAGSWVAIQTEQEGLSSLSVVPSSITYLPSGGTYGITATWTAGNEPTVTVTYVQGEGGWMTPTGSGTVTGNTKEWAWTASANNTGSSRTALITVTNGLQSETVTVSQASGGEGYYIRWTPYLSSGSFSINSTYYSFSDYQSCYFSNFSGTITSSAFMSTNISTLETNATRIEKNAFKGCGSLSDISVPNCAYIISSAFYGCSMLSEISLPKCSYLGFSVFENCTSLSKITLGYSSICVLYDYAFDSTLITSSRGAIFVPASLVSDYKTAFRWSYFSNRIFPIS